MTREDMLSFYCSVLVAFGDAGQRPGHAQEHAAANHTTGY
jgi:hypothetical protein